MTRPDPSTPAPDTPRDEALAAVEAPEPEPQPEPWTPERVTVWNAYYDMYVLGAALLLVFMASAIRTSHAPLWSHLGMGRQIIAQKSPLLADPFSYTEGGKTWVNVPWLFQAASAGLHDAAYGLVPVAPDDPTANRASAEQVAAGALVALTALLRLATAFVLIKIRHRGPGLWWAALCTGLAFGAAVGPKGLMLGGIAQPAIVDPATWGILFLAIEMLLLFRGLGQDRRGALYGLVPLFLLWANVDESFLFGLIVLACATAGKLLDGRKAVAPAAGEGARPPVSAGLAAGVLLACALVVLANPSHVKIYPAALEPVTSLFVGREAPATTSQLSYFGKMTRDVYGDFANRLMLYYLATVALGAATFAVNAAGFRWSRFLPFAFAAVAWGVYMRHSAEFATVLAAVATLNGQEWYRRRFGTEGRTETGWTVFSTGGRLATLAAAFACAALAITGYLKEPGEARFGFGFDRDDFAFKAADYLASRDDLKGNVFNWNAFQGDAIIWRAGPGRKTYTDSRSHLFPDALLAQHREIQNALRDDDPSAWRPALDEHGITAVMVDAQAARNTYRRLSQSPNWIPFHDDGKVVMFGRADAPEPDLAMFRANRLDPDLRAYKVSVTLPAADRPPTPVGMLDDFSQARALTPARAAVDAARRWLAGGTDPDGTPAPPDPARCLLAIREARVALAENPDDTDAYRILALAYRSLAQLEAAILSGIEPTAENRQRVAAIRPGGPLMAERVKQIITAVNYAIQTTPSPRTADQRGELMGLRLELFELYGQLGFVDLARDQLRAALDLTRRGELAPEARLQYQSQLQQLDQQVSQVEQAASELRIERQAGPVELGQFALSQGAAGLAIAEFEDAHRSNLSPTLVKPQLLDLYCATGQPERALEVIAPTGATDPSLGDPATAAFRQGLVYKLMGNYSYAVVLWRNQALPRLAYDRTSSALEVIGSLRQGSVIGAVNAAQGVPGMLQRQASWSFDLAQCLLESGDPEGAAESFTTSLELVPDLAMRPLIAYYLEKLGRPVPPERPAEAAPARAYKPEPPPDPIDEPKPAEAEAEAGEKP
ncbi:tetratricopeptide repeat protein [Paludisphaera sp.]|uniref:tetratricopeptide repeat protein n=1 Tax=Paludisphaera sp. TaxID=2017432 RepID=UPI00301E60EE